jgi:predicted Ser/Thr protein kinase
MAPLDPERWRRLQAALDRAIELPVHERGRWLHDACAGDPELRKELGALLQADAQTTGILESSAARFVGEAIRALHSSDVDVLTHASEFTMEPDDATRLLPGTRVDGRYRIVSLLGRGGMGEVYRADDLKLGQAVALKFFPLALEGRRDYLERLLHEARVARQVSHPNVCRVYDVGEWQNRQFISMEYIDGESLASLIARIGHLPLQKAVDVARQLCAGLEATHRLGILHCDLKPSNVMLDGRGQVRITDFGVAVVARQLRGHAAFAGTPAYMAPEQLDGREATARSDVYALGLILYELFTGRPAFHATTIEELRRVRLESSAPSPSGLVEGLDPAIERIILRCLEKDPALRPASARDVAAGLPRGDPLDVALAAGETPSPELVAASGPEGALAPRIAFATLAGTIAMLIVSALLVDHASILGWVSSPRSADALSDHARGILERLGHTSAAVDRAELFVTNRSWIAYVYAHDPSPQRWDSLRKNTQIGLMFFYRQASSPLAPLGRNGWVTDVDPAPKAGDAQVVLNARGRLFYLVAIPKDADPPVERSQLPDWSALFREAGLDQTRFRPTGATRNPAVAADSRAAWEGMLDELGYPVRIEAAAYRGTPVFFELVLPWDRYWDPSAPTEGTSSRSPITGYGIAMLFAVIVTGMLAIRNWVSGRGDRRGAFRLAAIVFVLRFAVWVLGGHHVSSPADEAVLLLVALGKSLTDAFGTWCFYLALEPHGRRLHPQFLVSWTRLLRGNLRDPLVGRDILHGVALSTIIILLWGQLWVILPHALKLSPPAPMQDKLGVPPFLYLLDSPPSRALLGGRYVLEAIPGLPLQALAIVLVWMMTVLGLNLLLRKGWIAVLVAAATASMLAWPSTQSHFNPVSVACSIAGAGTLVWSLRYGLIGNVALWVCLCFWMNFPVTARMDTPYFGTGLVAMLLIVSLGAYGAITASRGYVGEEARRA